MWDVKTYGAFKWYYQFGDEFTGNALDKEKWRIGLPWGNAVMSQDLFFDDTFIVTPKPNNYDTIKEKIETLIKNGI